MGVSKDTVAPTESVHIREARGTTCEVHGWPTQGLAGRLIRAMRERHGKGGVDVCRECIIRARDAAKERVTP